MTLSRTFFEETPQTLPYVDQFGGKDGKREDREDGIPSLDEFTPPAATR
jgi:hypothetical protein